jgi:zinc transporter, ZIP family
VSGPAIVAMGVIAGATIALGLPVARMRGLPIGARAMLNATAIGILLFLFFDVTANAFDPVESALTAAHGGSGSWLRFIGLAAVFGGGLVLGIIPLAYYDRWMKLRREARPGIPAGTPSDPPVRTGETAVLTRPRLLDVDNPAVRLALLIAVGIGMHKFSEGLAIGQAGASGEISLAVLLVVGFALHNATEGFGITAPFASSGYRPEWRLLGLLGLIGGGPTFIGTIVGQSFTNDAVSILFLSMAAGSILFVVIEMLGVARKIGRAELLYWGLLLGLGLGFGTECVVVAAGV